MLITIVFALNGMHIHASSSSSSSAGASSLKVKAANDKALSAPASAPLQQVKKLAGKNNHNVPTLACTIEYGIGVSASKYKIEIDKLASVELSPDRKIISVKPKGQGQITIYATDTEDQIGQPISGDSARFSPDSKIMLVRSKVEDQEQITIYATDTGDQIGQSISGFQPEFSPDSKIMLANSTDAQDQWQVRIYATDSGRQIGQPISGHWAQLSPDSKTMLVSSQYVQSQMQIYAIDSGRQIGQSISGFQPEFSPDSKIILVKSIVQFKSHMKIYETNSGRQIGQSISGYWTKLSPDSKIILVNTINEQAQLQTTMYATGSGRQIGQPFLGYSPVFSPDSKIMLIVLADEQNQRQVTMYATDSGRQIGQRIPGSYAEFSPDGRIMLIRSENAQDQRQVTMYATDSRRQIGQPVPVPASMYDTAFSADGKKVVICDSLFAITESGLQNIGTYNIVSDDFRYACAKNESERYTIFDVNSGMPIGCLPRSEDQAKLYIKHNMLRAVVMDSHALFNLRLIEVNSRTQAALEHILVPQQIKRQLLEFIMGPQPARELSAEEKIAKEQEDRHEQTIKDEIARARKQAKTRESDCAALFKGIVKKDDVEVITPYITSFTVNSVGGDSNTPLMKAIICGAKEVALALLNWRELFREHEYSVVEKQIELDTYDQGVKSLCLAIQYNYFDIGLVIANKMAANKLLKPDKNGKTAYDLLRDKKEVFGQDGTYKELEKVLTNIRQSLAVLVRTQAIVQSAHRKIGTGLF